MLSIPSYRSIKCEDILLYFIANWISLVFLTAGQKRQGLGRPHLSLPALRKNVMFLFSRLHVLELGTHMESMARIGTAESLAIALSTWSYLTFEEMQLLWGKPQICGDKALLQISVLSKWHLFSCSPLTAPAGVDKPQIVVQSATEADSDGSWFDPLYYTRSLRCHQFFRAQNVLIEGYSRSHWLKSPDEDKIHTKMHEHPTHTLSHTHTPSSKSWMRPDSHTLQERDRTREKWHTMLHL